MSSRMLRSGIRSEIFDLPVPSRHGKERQKLERHYLQYLATLMRTRKLLSRTEGASAVGRQWRVVRHRMSGEEVGQRLTLDRFWGT
ncbi:unnamed protein product [Spirodela intermedia]|uniref:Uncharacterized protein n=2 Tax=Spirodela intermedia TaxID=51605 RepID=A0A7I8LHY2_SPIIN|nr:unnamed protein product [Spirodela intermedia]CAA7409462.1 unnamed protein product [Spirodela intermedia]